MKIPSEEERRPWVEFLLLILVLIVVVGFDSVVELWVQALSDAGWIE